ncbi:hypothetical protein VTL71DRAFT_2182 [Oculimacula yallundae]|uniref:Uncharacterized protein n=1 Tax=Oculimacula yallundae TaxID=86028 RepID=A0ABR4C9F6_9HELO
MFSPIFHFLAYDVCVVWLAPSVPNFQISSHCPHASSLSGANHGLSSPVYTIKLTTPTQNKDHVELFPVKIMVH